MEKKSKKEGLFVNFSNHPSGAWAKEQITAAMTYGSRIVDLPFPPVDPAIDEAELDRIAEKKTEEIMSMKPAAVMCQGEFGLSFSVIKRLLAAGVTVLYACSERKVHTDGNVKTIQFDFVRFRKYF